MPSTLVPQNAPGFPERPPFLIWTGAALAAVAAAVTTPTLLIELGPLRNSLTSDNDSTRQFAEMTVLGFRLACGASAVLLTAIAARWRAVKTSWPVRWIMAHQPLVSPSHESIDRLWNRSLKVVLLSAGIALLYLQLGASWFPAEWQQWIRMEDGVIEYATAGLFAVCCLLASVLAFKMRHVPRYAVMLALMAFVFFVAVGEEISWGQRIFGIETIEALQSVNVQNENNLHNLFGYLADHAFIAVVFTYGAIVPLLCWMHPFWRKLFDTFGLPVATAGLAVGFAFVSMWHDWTIYRVFSDATGIRIAEVRELLTALCVVLLLWETRRLADASTAEPPGRRLSAGKVRKKVARRRPRDMARA